MHREQARHGFVNGVRECLVAAESSPFSCHGGDTIVISGGRSPPSLFVDSLQRPSAANGLNEPDTGLHPGLGLIRQPCCTVRGKPGPRYIAVCGSRRLRLSPIYRLARVYSVTTGVAPPGNTSARKYWTAIDAPSSSSSSPPPPLEIA